MKNFIKQLKNPFTEEYNILKKDILNVNFLWNYKGTTDPKLNLNSERYSANTMYQHCIVTAVDVSPNFLVPRIDSQYAELAFIVIKQILSYNNIEHTQIHRCVVNQIHYWDGKPSPPHLDHDTLSHKNCIIYLNHFDDGQIDVYSDDGDIESYKPMQDDIITFDGYDHSIHQPAPMQRRVCIVFTYS